MMQTSSSRGRHYRIWIADPGTWEPMRWDDRPTAARVVAPAAEGLFTAAQAAAFLKGFNTELLHQPKQRWGIAVAVDLQCRGDLRPGQAWRSLSTRKAESNKAFGRPTQRMHAAARRAR